jgi:type II secretory pathway component PulM
VREDSKGMLSVNYAALVSPIVKSIQEQQDEIEALKKQNAELKKRLDDIEVLLKKIATQNK